VNPLLHPIWWFKLSRAVGRRDHAKVLEMTQKVLRKRPDNPVALTFAALHSEPLGRREDALRYARKALAIDDEDFELHCLMTRLLDPVKEANEIAEHARWIIAIAETTLPGRKVWLEKADKTAQKFMFNEQVKVRAAREFSECRQFETDVVTWARQFLAYYENSKVEP
jgi:tetratricopeptide (TPR) repeat protein